jgi:hypothetical protein
VEPREDASVVRFRSGKYYNYVAIRKGGQWHTSARSSARADEPIHEYAWNHIDRVEAWPDLLARCNTFAVATAWASAPAVLKNEGAVVRFMMEGSTEWHAAIHAGSGSWYATIDDGEHGSSDGYGLRIYDHRIRGFGDIVEYSSRIDVATEWEPLPGIGLPPAR